jgi:RHS repeat-associated protein
MAFGEAVEFNKRTAGLGYDEVPETRKGYTGYEKDDESGLDFAQARYYNPKHGRFTSVDPLTASANVKNPQTFNRYSYVLNSPYKFTDPLGLISSDTAAKWGSKKEKRSPFTTPLCLGCDSVPFDLFDLPEDLQRDINRDKRQIPGDVKWIDWGDSREKTDLEPDATVSIPDEMASELIRDATYFFNRGIQEMSLYWSARQEIRENEEIFKTFVEENPGRTITPASVSPTDNGPGAQLCIAGNCNPSTIIVTSEIVLWGFSIPLSQDQLVLRYPRTAEYNEFVRETNSELKKRGVAFGKRFSGTKTNVNSGKRRYRPAFGRWANTIWEEIMKNSRSRGNRFV